MKPKINLGTEDGLKSFLYSMFANKQIVLDNFSLDSTIISGGFSFESSSNLRFVNRPTPGTYDHQNLYHASNNSDSSYGIVGLLLYYFDIKCISQCKVKTGTPNKVMGNMGTVVSYCPFNFKINDKSQPGVVPHKGESEFTINAGTLVKNLYIPKTISFDGPWEYADAVCYTIYIEPPASMYVDQIATYTSLVMSVSGTFEFIPKSVPGNNIILEE